MEKKLHDPALLDVEKQRSRDRDQGGFVSEPLSAVDIPAYAQVRQSILSQFSPSGQRPKFDIPRFWSNPGLTDPDRIISLVLAKPSMGDLARTIHAYGPDRVIACLGRMIEQESLRGSRITYTKHLVKLALEGVADAAHELAAG